MPWVTRDAAAMLAMLVATAVVQPRLFAAEPLPRVETMRAEVQIGLCAPADQIKKALDLRPGGISSSKHKHDDIDISLLPAGEQYDEFSPAGALLPAPQRSQAKGRIGIP
jgi:hypothetical protein